MGKIRGGQKNGRGHGKPASPVFSMKFYFLDWSMSPYLVSKWLPTSPECPCEALRATWTNVDEITMILDGQVP
jgi:hypothetical protein